MVTVRMQITRQDFHALEDLVVKDRFPPWNAVFGCNDRLEVWPFVTFGPTPLEDREFLQGSNRLLDEIVKNYVAARPEAGRIFINDSGAHYVTDREYFKREKEFISFQFSDSSNFDRNQPDVPREWRRELRAQERRMEGRWRKS